MATSTVLDVRDLRLSFAAPVVRGVSFAVDSGFTTAIVGESGSGKTLSCLSLLGIEPPGAAVEGSAILDGQELIGAQESELCRVRSRKIGFVFQAPRAYMNPSRRVGSQIEETAMRGLGIGRREASERGLALLDAAGLDAARVARSYPHELSGGMCQRVSIVLAICCDPLLLIADEPTTALDASIQRSILDVLLGLVKDRGMGMIFVTHDLRAVDYVADTVQVMLSGLIVEAGPRRLILGKPAHPYTKLLLESLPEDDFLAHREHRRLSSEGEGPTQIGASCPFLSRCPNAAPSCAAREPALRLMNDGRLLRCPVVGGTR